jgi:hypothetical protein
MCPLQWKNAHKSRVTEPQVIAGDNTMYWNAGTNIAPPPKVQARSIDCRVQVVHGYLATTKIRIVQRNISVDSAHISLIPVALSASGTYVINTARDQVVVLNTHSSSVMLSDNIFVR